MRYPKIKIYVLILILFISVLIINQSSFVSAIYYETEIIYPSKDAHICNYLPDNNYGDSEDMYCGNCIAGEPPALQKHMVYMQFNLSSIEPNWESIFLALNIEGISVPFDLDIGIVNEDWNETFITWNNRPLDITLAVKSLNLTMDGTYILNVTDLISYIDSEFSLILYDQHTMDEGTVLISSRENPTQVNRPQLQFSYVRQSELRIPSYPLEGLLLIILTGIIIISDVLKNRNKKCVIRL